MITAKRCTSGTYKTGFWPDHITSNEITELLGFGPNTRETFDGKVTMMWEFTIDGKEAAIWDYKGVRWSIYDPAGKTGDLLDRLTIGRWDRLDNISPILSPALFVKFTDPALAAHKATIAIYERIERLYDAARAWNMDLDMAIIGQQDIDALARRHARFSEAIWRLIAADKATKPMILDRHFRACINRLAKLARRKNNKQGDEQ